ncbi:geranylgeranyl reductase family protein [Chitinophaga sancti]|uniref:NAD(P)/FAD-dependent oxidoreductase n=1 Tax=Chitinophaga sancti TaxID=1004 RepID=UPI002A75F422|nr:geranylgeranyl reductase family protein [Chitinophaga sancti]WPQ64306.1 geranylgeranyl reductase family protein [Chitinophaga sancti]
MLETKVCIIGAGPGGAAAALQLAQLGVECVVVDKAVFPRDKVCGDGLSGKVITALNRIDPAIATRLKEAEFKVNSWGVTFVSPGRHSLDVGYRPDYNSQNEGHKETPIGYVCKRMDFDNFLVDEIKRRKEISLYENVNVDKYELLEDGYLVSGNKGGFQVKAKLLIIANGAHSSFTKEVAGITMEPNHYVAGIRAYYKNVSGNNPDNFIELHFLKSLLPGYFWVFPLPNGEANVGVGILSEAVRKKKINLKKEMLDIIANDPVFKERFKNAELISNIEGYGLPLGSKVRVLHGERYMLVGDAAYLIDPFTGEGIGNALYSGRLAAIQANEALQANNFSAAQLAKYDSEVYRVMGPELKLSHRLQKLIRFPWLFNTLMKVSSRNKQLQELLSCMFYEVDLRKRLTKPSFYFKLLLNR